MGLPIMAGLSIDERGRAMGGKAGDQTGKEAKRRTWYRHPLGWYVLRPISPVDAEILASTMEDIVDNDNIGYDQGQRNTLLDAGRKVGWDASKITTKVEGDCSKGVQFCCFAAGIQAGKWNDSFRTGNMIPTMMATGRFVKLTADKYCRVSTNLMRGDVLVTRKAGHTVIMTTDGSNIKRVLGSRPLTRGADGPDVEELQRALKTLGYGKLLGHWGEGKDGVDGDYGQATMSAVKAFEKDHGLPIDGTADIACIKAIVSAVISGEPVVVPIEEDQPDDNAPDDTPDGTEESAPDSIPDYKCNWVVATQNLNVRTGPGTGFSKKIFLFPGTGLIYDGETKDGWHAVLYRGKRHWVSGKMSKFEVREKYMLDISVYDDVEDWTALKKYVSYIWIRVACRRRTSVGEVYIDADFKKFAAACKKWGIPFGVYVYGRAKTAAGGREEAQKAVAWAEPYGPTTYMYDIEATTLTQISCQAFIDEASRLTGKPSGMYVGRHWSQVNAGELKNVAFIVSPYYRTDGGGTHGDRNPSHPHDAHQYTCSLIVAGKTDPGDCSHINTDPKTNHKGRSIEYFRTGGKVA